MKVQDIFAYRCGRLQNYILTYLHPKNISQLVASDICHGTSSPSNTAIFNYLFNYDYAGQQLYDASSKVQDILLVVSADVFVWYADQIQTVEFIKQFISGLTNHQIICGHTMDTITSTTQYQINNGNVQQINEEEYKNQYQIAKVISKNPQLNKQNVVVEQPVLFDASCDTPPQEIVLKKIVKVSENKMIAIAGPPTEESAITQFLINKLGLKPVAVQQSLLQLIFGHVDAGCYQPIKQAASQLKRQYCEIIDSIKNAETLANQLFKLVPKNQEDGAFPQTSFCKFNPTTDQSKKQVTKNNNGIYDIYLSHPKIPIIYRQPYIQEIDNLHSFQLLGFVSNLFETECFSYLNKLLKENEENVSTKFKEFLKVQLLKDQPANYVESLLQLIQTLKLNVEYYQLDGKKLFGRYFQNIQIAMQLKVKSGIKDAVEIQTIFFGRSYISTPSGYLNVNDLGELSSGLFVMKERIPMCRFDQQKNDLGKLEITDQNSKIVAYHINMLLHNKQTNAGEIVRIPIQYDAVFSFCNFAINMDVSFLNKQIFNMKNTINSKKYIQLMNVQQSQIDDINKFQIIFHNKKLHLISFNLQLLLDNFGNYIFGHFCYEMTKYIQFVTQSSSSNYDLEGFSIEIDFLNKTNYNVFSKTFNEEYKDDLVQYTLLRDYTFYPPIFEEITDSLSTQQNLLDQQLEHSVLNQNTKLNPIIKCNESFKAMLIQDINYIFKNLNIKEEDVDYQDKLLLKAQTEKLVTFSTQTTEKQQQLEQCNNQAVIITIQNNNCNANYQIVSQLLKLFIQKTQSSNQKQNQQFKQILTNQQFEQTLKELKDLNNGFMFENQKLKKNVCLYVIVNEIFQIPVIHQFKAQFLSFYNIGIIDNMSFGINLLDQTYLNDSVLNLSNYSAMNNQLTQILIASNISRTSRKNKLINNFYIKNANSKTQDKENTDLHNINFYKVFYAAIQDPNEQQQDNEYLAQQQQIFGQLTKQQKLDQMQREPMLSQLFLNTDSMRDLIIQLKPINFNSVILKQLYINQIQQSSFQQIEIATPLQISNISASLKNLSQLFSSQSSQSFFKQLLNYSDSSVIQFGKFIIQIYAQSYIIDIHPQYLVDSKELQLTAQFTNTLTQQQISSVQTLLHQFADLLMNNLMQNTQQLQQFKHQQEDEAKRNATWQDIEKFYSNVELPGTWFWDYNKYMNLNGQISIDRPDKKELIAKYRKEVIGETEKPKQPPPEPKQQKEVQKDTKSDKKIDLKQIQKKK